MTVERVNVSIEEMKKIREKSANNFPFGEENFIHSCCASFAVSDDKKMSDVFREAWVILVDRTSHDSLIKPFHIEPLSRFWYNPPKNERYEVFRVVKSSKDALDWIKSDEALEILKSIVTFPIVETLQGKTVNPLIKEIEPKFKRMKISKSARIKVFERDNYRCQICGRGAQDGVTLEVDHIIPRAKGGSNNINNLQVLCFDCNRGKRDKVLPNLINSNTI